MASDYDFGQYSTGDKYEGGTWSPVDESSTTPTDYAEVAKDMAILFMTGIAVLIALITLVYVGSLVCDVICNRCGCCAAMRALHNNETRHVEGGEVARDAGLTGITGAERRAVLGKMLVGKSYRAHKQMAGVGEASAESDEHAGDGNAVDGKANTVSLSSSGSAGSSDQSTQGALDIESQQMTSMSSSTSQMPVADDPFQSDSYTACAICIDDYDDSDEVFVGGDCNHMFHKECLLDWLVRHDGCPCCRKNMITSDRMKEAAVEVLGRDRVMELALGPYYSNRMSIGVPQALPRATDLALDNTSAEND
jgi:hypothetical protein